MPRSVSLSAMDMKGKSQEIFGVFDGATASYAAAANTHGFSIFNHQALRDIRLLVVGSAPITSQAALDILTRSCAEVIPLASIGDADLLLQRTGSAAPTLMIVHCDRFADHFETLLFFRELWPFVTVLVGSEDLRRNDLSTARGLLCDASLRLPYTKVGLALGLQAALNNSREMQQRQMYHWATVDAAS